MKLEENSLFPIGKKYLHVKMEKVPASYLLWYWEGLGLWDRDRLYSEEYFAVHDYIRDNFSALEEEAEDFIITHRPERKK